MDMDNQVRSIKVVRKEILDEVQNSIIENRDYDKDLMEKLGKELMESCILVLYTSKIDIYGVMLMTVEKIIDTEVPEATFSTYDERKGFRIGINPVILSSIVKEDSEMVSMFLHEALHIAHGHLIEFRLLRSQGDQQLKMLSHLGMDLSIFEMESDFYIGNDEESRKVLPVLAPNVKKTEDYLKEKFNLDNSFKLKREEGSHYYINKLVKLYKEHKEDLFESLSESIQNMIEESKEKQNERSEESKDSENEQLKNMLEQLKDIEKKNNASKDINDNRLDNDSIDNFENSAQEYMDNLDDMNGNDEDTNNDSSNQQNIEQQMNDLIDSMKENSEDKEFDQGKNNDLSDKIEDMKSEMIKQMMMNNLSQGQDSDSNNIGENLDQLGNNSTMSSSLEGNKKYEDMLDENPLKDDATEERMKDQLHDLLVTSSSNSRGTTPAHIQEQIEILKRKPKIKWQDYLKSKVGKKRAGRQKTILRRNRRQPYRTDIRGTLPGRKIGKIFAAIDTSGSMSRQEIEEIIAELYYISNDMKIDLVLLFFSSDVEEVVKVNRPNQFNNYVLGRGGTIFSSVFDFLNDTENKNKYDVSKEDILLFFSDGFGESEVDYGILSEIIWVITDDTNNLSVRDPKGKVLELKVDDNGRDYMF